MHKSKFDKAGINEEHRGSYIFYVSFFFWYFSLCKFNSFILLAYNLLYLHEDTSNISEWRWSYIYNVRVAFFIIISTVFYGVIKLGILCCMSCMLWFCLLFGFRIIWFMNFVVSKFELECCTGQARCRSVIYCILRALNYLLRFYVI